MTGAGTAARVPLDCLLRVFVDYELSSAGAPVVGHSVEGVVWETGSTPSTTMWEAATAVPPLRVPHQPLRTSCVFWAGTAREERVAVCVLWG